MLHFILRRIALAIPTLFLVALLVFLAARLAPSSPIDIMLGDKGTPQARELLTREYGLDKPLPEQFLRYVAGVARGDFGKSFTERGQPVLNILGRGFPVTAQLAIQALLFALLVGIPAGIGAALAHNSWFDRALMTLVVALVSVPSMVLGPVLVLFVSIRLGLLPVSGWRNPNTQIVLAGWGTPLFLDTLLPSITLGARSAALIARFMRASLLDVLKQDYMRTAIAKGLSWGQAVHRHALKNALLPVLTVLGTNFGYLLTGSFVVETIFQVPGIGYYSLDSITRRDYPVMQAMALLVALIFVVVNLVVDVLYGVIDPRVRAQEAA